MTTKRGHHPDDIPLSEAELKRRKSWRAQDPRQKDYGRGTEVIPEQQEMALDLNIRDNADLPLSLQDIKNPSQTQKTPLFCPETPEQDPNCVYGGVRNRLYSHFSKTIMGQYHTAAKKIAEQRWLDANSHPETTIIKHPSRHLRRSLDQKLHPKYYRERPKRPKNYQQLARNAYPTVAAPLCDLLYLRNNCLWVFDDIAFRFASSPRQIEWCYNAAREQHIATSVHCPPSISFNKKTQI